MFLCSNITGNDKLKLILIGKSIKPRDFKGFSTGSYIQYEGSKKAWMTAFLFNKWIKQWDQKLRFEKRKICLVIDNCTSHKISNSLSNIEVIFLPPNTTSILQPMDSGIIRCFKAYFNGYKLSQISDMIDSKKPVEACFKSINIRDVAVFTSLSWKKVTKKTIYNCFSHSGWISKIYSNEKDSLCETFKSEFSDFIKENKIIDSITFDKYCEEDFNLKQIN